jgi:hypothetical protein
MGRSLAHWLATARQKSQAKKMGWIPPPITRRVSYSAMKHGKANRTNLGFYPEEYATFKPSHEIC